MTRPFETAPSSPQPAGTLAPGTVLLDTARPDAENGRCLLFSRPRGVLTACTLSEVPALLRQLDAAVQGGLYAAGYLSYEAGYAFESASFAPLPRTEQLSTKQLIAEGAPLAWFGLYDAPAALDAGAVEALLSGAASHCVRHPRFSIDRASYAEKLARIKAYIRAGDVYQINFTGAVRFGFEGAPLSLYRALRRRQRVPYGAFINTGPQCLLSLSPELFFRRAGDRITARPMKGTVRRGRTRREDEALREGLARDEKSRAENLMIVDLLRNDLSVCCRPGSVRVPALFQTEPYESVTQMTSTVEGRLQEGAGYAKLFRALFPCGSVTGAPKIRAMQLIRELEDAPRGAYCGAVGYVGPGGQAVFNVAIRTIVLEGRRGTMGTGSGIIWDSEARAEYDECLLKARFLTEPPSAQVRSVDDAFDLIETMRAEGRAVPLIKAHFARLRDAAAYFGFPFDEQKLRAKIEAAVQPLDAEAAHKVRLTLGPRGAAQVTTSAVAWTKEEPWRVLFATPRADADDPFFYHKTTHRRVYEAAYAEAQAAGCDEALLLNAQGAVTEGTFTNVFIKKDGAFYTPPVACGLLGGVYRAHLLEALPNAAEHVLRPSDLFTADALYLCNAVRGLVRATLVRKPAGTA